MHVVSGQVRAGSGDGKDAVTDEIKVGGFKPNTWAHVVIAGWSFKFRSGDHPIKDIGLWLQHAVLGGSGWEWAMGIPVGGDGVVWARYYVFAGSENRDNPYDALINYVIIGE